MEKLVTVTYFVLLQDIYYVFGKLDSRRHKRHLIEDYSTVNKTSFLLNYTVESESTDNCNFYISSALIKGFYSFAEQNVLDLNQIFSF